MKILSPDDYADITVSSAVKNAPNQVLYSCYKCHGDAWVSPSGQRRIKKYADHQVMCLPCYALGLLSGEIKKGETAVSDEETLKSDVGNPAEAEQIMNYLGFWKK